jgi:hypothetical protein
MFQPFWRSDSGKKILFSNSTLESKRFGISIFNICDYAGYIYAMEVYLQEDRQCAVQQVTATHVTMKDLTIMVEGHGYKLYMAKDFLFLLFWWPDSERNKQLQDSTE